jgi:hypothetical protein
MISLDESQNVFVCGPVCSGKTNLLNTWLKEHNRYIRFDYTGETLNAPNVEHVYKLKPLLDRLEENPLYFRISYHPGKNVMEHYRWVQKCIWMLDTPRVLAMDEYHRVCPQTTKLDEDVEYSLRMARHNLLGIIGLSQRPQDVAKLFIDSCRKCVIYKSQEGNFLDACANHWGDDVASAVEKLRPLVHNDVTKVTKQVPQCVVVTRDGQAPKIYDFSNDGWIPIQSFLEGSQIPEKEETESEENAIESCSEDNGEEGSSGSVSDNAGITSEGQ